MERECLWERLFINSMSHYSIAQTDPRRLVRVECHTFLSRLTDNT